MKELAEKVAKKTGLSKAECDGIIKVVMRQIILELRDAQSVRIRGFGDVFRFKNDRTSDILGIKLTKDSKERLYAPNDNEEHSDEIDFE